MAIILGKPATGVNRGDDPTRPPLLLSDDQRSLLILRFPPSLTRVQDIQTIRLVSSRPTKTSLR
jgi:hypothetical protein